MREQESRAKDIVLLNAVWRAWVTGHPVTCRDLAALLDRTSAPTWFRTERLIRDGWLAKDVDRRQRTLRPGPRFAGLYDGMPMEIVG